MYKVINATLEIIPTTPGELVLWDYDALKTANGNYCFEHYKDAKHYVLQFCQTQVACYQSIMEMLV